MLQYNYLKPRETPLRGPEGVKEEKELPEGRKLSGSVLRRRRRRRRR